MPTSRGWWRLKGSFEWQPEFFCQCCLKKIRKDQKKFLLLKWFQFFIETCWKGSNSFQRSFEQSNIQNLKFWFLVFEMQNKNSLFAKHFAESNIASYSYGKCQWFWNHIQYFISLIFTVKLDTRCMTCRVTQRLWKNVPKFWKK